MNEKVHESFRKLADYCEKENYKGYDPYDGLNSSLFRSIPFLSKNRLARLTWIQAFKRSPFNLRQLTGVNKDYNPKALGLFLSGFCNLYRLSEEDRYLEKIGFFSEKIIEVSNQSWSGSCWGYNFDWQARAFFQPAYTPTVVATTFVGCSLLDAYEITGNTKLLDVARSSCDFIIKDLNRTYDNKGNFAFSYSPLDRSVVYNASLLGSRLLARVYGITKEDELKTLACKSVKFCCDRQNEDGSWSYGQLPFHKWIDNFHTGYNLECIADYIKYTGDSSFSQNLEKGFDYYLRNFFTPEGIAAYYNNSLYPVDTHSVAQLVVTVSKTSGLNNHNDLVGRVLNWTIDNMQSDKGYFYYQVNRFFSSRIPYMRWAQAWMFYGMSTWLLHSRK
jgi:rhamnogalacturonyl hydrolase YesR